MFYEMNYASNLSKFIKFIKFMNLKTVVKCEYVRQDFEINILRFKNLYFEQI